MVNSETTEQYNIYNNLEINQWQSEPIWKSYIFKNTLAMSSNNADQCIIMDNSGLKTMNSKTEKKIQRIWVIQILYKVHTAN